MKTIINTYPVVQKAFAVLAIVALLFSSAPFAFAQAPGEIKIFTASVTPGSIDAGEVNKSFSFTITNDGSSEAVIKSASIGLPAGFTVSNLTVDDSEFEVELNGSDIETSLMPGNTDGVDPGDSLTITADITNLSGSGNSSWEVCAFKNNSFNPGGGASFDFEGGIGCGAVEIEIIDEEPETGSITVIKETDDESGDSVEFSFSTDETLSPSTFSVLGDGVDSEVFNDLEAGEYSVIEDGETGWTFDSFQCVNSDEDEVGTPEGNGVNITLAEGEDVICTFSNTMDEDPPTPGTITVYKVVDDVSGESVEFDFVIDSSNNDFDGEMDILGGGNQSRDDILPATYTFTEGVEGGWTLDDVSCSAEGDSSFEYLSNGVTVTFAEGDNVSCTFYNDMVIVDPELGSISGTKYNQSEDGLEGWTIFIDENDNQILDDEETSTVTDENGDYSFPNLEDGTYDVCEVMQEGWEQTFPDTENGCHEITITEGSDENANFVNEEIPLFTIDGYKFEDVNGDGDWNEDENGLQGWVIELYDGENLVATTTTDETGYYSFEVEEGSYEVSEVQQNGWQQITPAEGGSCEVSVGQIELIDQLIDAVIIDETDCDFGNQRIPDTLSCSLVVDDSTVESGELVSLSWTTTDATDVSIDQGIGAVALNGATDFSVENDVTFTLTATDVQTEESVQCQVSVDAQSGGGGGGGGGSRRSSNDDDPVPEVLGAQTEIMPIGAPNAGAGGTSQTTIPATFLIALLGTGVAVRKLAK